MDELVNLLITTAVGLVILGGSYLLDLVIGTIKVLYTKNMKWNWHKMLEDLVKAILIAVATESWVALCYIAGWYANKVGLDITHVTDALSIGGMIGAVAAGSIWYLASAGANLLEFLNKHHVEVHVDEDKADYQAIVDKVKEFADSITEKRGKDDNKLDGKDINIEEAGKGGIVNTYIEPYRSKPKDTILDPSTCWNRECVSYASWKICETVGRWQERTGPMSAKYWVDRLPSWGFKEVSAPQNGGKYVGINQGGEYGHAVWFEFDNTISEYNYASLGNFGVRTVNLKQYRWYEIKKPTPAPTPVPPTPTTQVTYTYKKGDTFGQVICDLGLKTSHGLWGADGDVAYYTEQLHKQGIYGNIPIGTTIVLTPRPN